MIKRIFLVIISGLLAFTLSGCQKTGTVEWINWAPAHKGDTKGQCRVGLKNTVDEDGNKLGDYRFTKRGVTKWWCYSTYKKGRRVTIGS